MGSLQQPIYLTSILTNSHSSLLHNSGIWLPSGATLKMENYGSRACQRIEPSSVANKMTENNATFVVGTVHNLIDDSGNCVQSL